MLRSSPTCTSWGRKSSSSGSVIDSIHWTAVLLSSWSGNLKHRWVDRQADRQTD